MGNNRPKSLTCIPPTTTESKKPHVHTGKCDVKGSSQHDFCKGQPGKQSAEVHRGGNKNVEILDILYFDFQVAFDNFSTKAVKMLSHYGLNEKSFCDLKMEKKVKG